MKHMANIAMAAAIAVMSSAPTLAGSLPTQARAGAGLNPPVVPVVLTAGSVIPPSAALQAALRSAPGSQGLSVRLLQDGKLVYVVRIKSGNKVQRILVDAKTGQVIGRR